MGGIKNIKTFKAGNRLDQGDLVYEKKGKVYRACSTKGIIGLLYTSYIEDSHECSMRKTESPARGEGGI